MKYWERQYSGLSELVKAYRRVNEGIAEIRKETYISAEAQVSTTKGGKFYRLLVEANVLTEEQERRINELISDKAKEP